MNFINHKYKNGYRHEGDALTLIYFDFQEFLNDILPIGCPDSAY